MSLTWYEPLLFLLSSTLNIPRLAPLFQWFSFELFLLDCWTEAESYEGGKPKWTLTHCRWPPFDRASHRWLQTLLKETLRGTRLPFHFPFPTLTLTFPLPLRLTLPLPFLMQQCVLRLKDRGISFFSGAIEVNKRESPTQLNLLNYISEPEKLFFKVTLNFLLQVKVTESYRRLKGFSKVMSTSK